jgi:hypothetical protein
LGEGRPQQLSFQGSFFPEKELFILIVEGLFLPFFHPLQQRKACFCFSSLQLISVATLSYLFVFFYKKGVQCCKSGFV